MNLFLIVGRIDEIIEVTSNQIELRIETSYRQEPSDELSYRKSKVNVYNTVADKVKEHCRPRDMVSVKGYIDVDEDYQIKLEATQVSFMVPHTK